MAHLAHKHPTRKFMQI
jgi:hypothetical protein